jgi:cyclopropane-fatty-acyl-phospholipid synthase
VFTHAVFRHLLAQGNLRILQPDGTLLGTARDAGCTPSVVMRVTDSGLLDRNQYRHPSLVLGEAYMDGRLRVEEGRLEDFLRLFFKITPNHPFEQWLMPLRQGLQQYNPVRLARRHVAHHYDLSDELYALFLDADLNYSCAYFQHPADSLEIAQQNKQRLIARKLLLQPGMRVLDIGCGWGSLALALARNVDDLRVTGLTLSQEQLTIARARAKAEGLENRVTFHLRDYRVERGRYDRIVSVGMFEHVGRRHYRTFFRKIRENLTAEGIALIHAIGRMDGPGLTNPWLRKYIFPGGYAPALSEVLPQIERQRLWLTDVEILRLHYAQTLRAWRERFLAHRERVEALYGARFLRMWELYLTGAELNFREGGMMVFQIQLARHVGTVPLTRDYLWADQEALVPAPV